MFAFMPQMEEMEMGSGSLGGSGSSDALHGHGLKFGKKVYFVDAGGGASASATPMPALPTMAPSGSSASLGSAPSPAVAPKRGKGATQGTQQQPPRCQVEGCGADLTGAKAYYCRHKVCNLHSKSPKVIVAGLEQRFCQQCSRFHQLPEFDQGKRSCRRRLAGHNERRRKPPPGSLSSHYGRLPSGLHEDGSGFGGLVLDFSHSRISSSARYEWPALSIGDGGATSHWQAGLGSETSGVVTNMAHSYMQGSASRTPFQNHEVSPSERLGVSDSGCALSLLSTRPWGTAPATRSRVPPTIPDNYEGSPMTQSGAADSFTSSSWSFRGQNSGSSSSTAHEHPHEVNLVRAAAAAPDRQFSGELELALQGSKRRLDSGSGRSYGPGDLMHHWSL